MLPLASTAGPSVNSKSLESFSSLAPGAMISLLAAVRQSGQNNARRRESRSRFIILASVAIMADHAMIETDPNRRPHKVVHPPVVGGPRAVPARSLSARDSAQENSETLTRPMVLRPER